MSCLVYLPRDRYTTAVRLRMEDDPARGLRRRERRLHDARVRVGAGPAALRRPGARPAQPIPDVDEDDARGAARRRDPHLGRGLRRGAARRVRRGGAARAWSALYGKAFPEAYKEDFPPRDGGRRPAPHRGARATATAIAAEPLRGARRPRPDERRFKLYRRGAAVADRRCCRCSPTWASRSSTSGRTSSRGRDGPRVHIYDFGLRRRSLRSGPAAAATGVRERVPGRVRRGLGRARRDRRLQRAGPRRRADLAAGRRPARRTPSTCARPARPSARTTSSRRLAGQRRHRRGCWSAVRGAVRPRPVSAPRPARRGERAAAQRSVERDQRRASTTWPASTTTGSCAPCSASSRRRLRTNYFQPDAGRPRRKPYVSFKLDPQAVPDLPAPRPMFEIWVYSPAGRGRAPALRQGRPRRPALVRPARGLPHRGPRPGQGADGQERRHRADRRQGRLRRQAAARPDRRPRGLAGRGHRVATARSSRRCSTSPTTCVGGDVVPPAAGRPARRRRHLPRRRRRQGHGDVLRHRQRRRARLRLLARRRVRLRRLGRLRPQGDGHHRARRLGVGQAALPRAGPRHPDRRTSPSSASAT